MRRSEKGFTTLTVLVALAITSIIAAGAGMVTVQIFQGSKHSGDHMTTVRQAQNVGYWVSKDILMARSISIGDDPETTDVEFTFMNWKDWETGDTYNIRYVLLDSADSLQKIKRKQLVCDKDSAEIENKTTLIADNIHTADLSLQNGMWRLNIEARSGDKSSTRVYEIVPRQEQQ